MHELILNHAEEIGDFRANNFETKNEFAISNDERDHTTGFDEPTKVSGVELMKN